MEQQNRRARALVLGGSIGGASWRLAFWPTIMNGLRCSNSINLDLVSSSDQRSFG
jgi:hypothetical protein